MGLNTDRIDSQANKHLNIIPFAIDTFKYFFFYL